MFGNIKNRFMSVISPDLPPLPAGNEYLLHRGTSGMSTHQLRLIQQQHMQDKFTYARPPILQLLTPDELRASADHNVRPIIVPRDISLLSWGTGYAECVNSGKSEWNEDQMSYCRQVLSDPTQKHPDLPYTYYGIFDGHAGYGAALAASHQLHHILHEKLVDCIDVLLPRDDDTAAKNARNEIPHPFHFQRHVSKDELIIGALESAFLHMDALIAQDRDRYRDAGGCTACVSLFINGKMYVANAGDSRAVLCLRKNAAITEKSETDIRANDVYSVPYSFDHTPETERERLLSIARLKPSLMGRQYVAMEYARRPHAKDLGQRILCRQGTMKGWTYKTLTREDLRMPVVAGEGKRSRLLGTLGVTRGFGDHDLLAINTGLQIKPFLTAHPEVRVRDLSTIVSIPCENNEDGDYGILVIATDGLWDVSENDAVAQTVFQTLAKYPVEKHRYTMVAQELVAKARGKINDSGHWRLADSKAAATVDDISVIVIPVHQYYKEHMDFEQNYVRLHQEKIAKLQQQSAVQSAIEAREEGLAIVTEEKIVNGNETTTTAKQDTDAEENVEARQLIETTVEINRSNEEDVDGIANETLDKEREDDKLDEKVENEIEKEVNVTAQALSETQISQTTEIKASPSKGKINRQVNKSAGRKK